MSAEELRRAAETLRRLAAKATPGAWKLWGMSVMADQDGTSNVDTAVDVAYTVQQDEHGKPRTFDADYIARMDPRVGLALADWLDDIAGRMEDRTKTRRGGKYRSTRHAHTIARLINGGAS